MNEREAFVALNLLPGIGPVRVQRLLEVFESPERILSAKADRLRAVRGIGVEVAEGIVSWQEKVDPVGELNRARAGGVEVLTWSDPAYPKLLREIYDPPIVLYVWGDATAWDTRTVGIVGTRKPSLYAAETTKKLAYQLASAKLTVASGLARGVDTAAHYAALAAHGRTVAVLGSGLEKLYPPENFELAEKIASSGGAVVSEFPMGMSADRQTFPMRNRIISGLSFGLLVVEAGGRSGALISASQAGDQGRSVYAVPGRIDHPGALGSNRLIQQGAKMVLCAQDILDDLGMIVLENGASDSSENPPQLSENEGIIMEAIGDDEVSMDALIGKCGLPTPLVSSTLLALEMRKLVRQLPGNRFAKLY